VLPGFEGEPGLGEETLGEGVLVRHGLKLVLEGRQ
jgi:hypothetical protein